MDIDIDIQKNTNISKLFTCVKASMVQNNELKPHLVGFYFQKIPKDKITNLSAIPYEKALEENYYKIDFLNLNLLESFTSKEEIRLLLRDEPNWDLLKDKNVVSQLFHLSKHYDLINLINPKSVLDLADIFALIRPNKHHLIDKYLKDKKSVIKELYTKREASDMRKSHAISYALLIKLQLIIIGKNK